MRGTAWPLIFSRGTFRQLQSAVCLSERKCRAKNGDKKWKTKTTDNNKISTRRRIDGRAKKGRRRKRIFVRCREQEFWSPPPTTAKYLLIFYPPPHVKLSITHRIIEHDHLPHVDTYYCTYPPPPPPCRLLDERKKGTEKRTRECFPSDVFVTGIRRKVRLNGFQILDVHSPSSSSSGRRAENRFDSFLFIYLCQLC